jgi:hypothetical protein
MAVHVGRSAGASRCNVEPVGLVVSGCAAAELEDGTIHELPAGTLFHIPADPPKPALGPAADSWFFGG